MEQTLARLWQHTASASVVPTPVASCLLQLAPAHPPSDQAFCSHLLGGQAHVYHTLVSCAGCENSSTNRGPGRRSPSPSSPESTGNGPIVPDPNSPLKRKDGIPFTAFACLGLQAFTPMLPSASPPPPPPLMVSAHKTPPWWHCSTSFLLGES